jgi:hypothetical protein
MAKLDGGAWVSGLPAITGTEMQIRIDTHLGDVVVTLEPTEGVKQRPTGAKYVWRLDADEAVRVGNSLLKAANLIEGSKG